MAVVSPVLERIADTEEKEYTREYRDTFISAEEEHNSRISENYAKLINPESKARDILPAEPVREQLEDDIFASTARAKETQGVYLVKNARADADIFRADSIINKRTIEASAVAPVIADAEEEENEDLRPTQTTIQYKTTGVKKTVEQGKIELRTETKHFALTKKDKIIIAVAVSIIVALFALIIVNSAIISGLNSDVSALQSTLTATENAYAESLAAKNAYLDETNIFQTVSDFATSNGMVLR